MQGQAQRTRHRERDKQGQRTGHTETDKQGQTQRTRHRETASQTETETETRQIGLHANSLPQISDLINMHAPFKLIEKRRR